MAKKIRATVSYSYTWEPRLADYEDFFDEGEEFSFQKVIALEEAWANEGDYNLVECADEYRGTTFEIIDDDD